VQLDDRKEREPSQQQREMAVKGQCLVASQSNDPTVYERFVDPLRGVHLKGRMSTRTRLPDDEFDYRKHTKSREGIAREWYTSKFFPERRPEARWKAVKSRFGGDVEHHLPRPAQLYGTNSATEIELPGTATQSLLTGEWRKRGEMSFYANKASRQRHKAIRQARTDKRSHPT
jgi:hypothetical protein